MAEGKILTVTIPAYNAGKYIEKCLDSMVVGEEALMQKLEVLIVDDGGTDDTREKAEKYCRRYPDSVHFCHKENGGHGSVINYGIEHATGRFFKVVDGDDWLNTPELSEFIRLLESSEADVIASDYLCIEDGTFRQLQHRLATEDASKYGRICRFDSGEIDTVIKMHSMTIRTDILKKMPQRMDEHCFYVDAEYITYPIPYASTVYYYQRDIYMYRLGRGGQTMSMRSMQKNHCMHRRVFDSLTKFYEKLPLISENKKHYIERCIAQIVENEFQIAISEGTKPGVREDLKSWDQQLRCKYPDIYARTQRKSITLLRKTDYRILPIGYLVLRIVKRRAFGE